MQPVIIDEVVTKPKSSFFIIFKQFFWLRHMGS